MSNPYVWVTQDFHLRNEVHKEILRGDIARATSAVSYSWIRKTQITKRLAGDPRLALDVGCGWGREIIQFRNAVGIDLSLPFLRTAKNYAPNYYVQADAHHLPFRSEVFDFIYCSEVIEHLPDVKKVIREMTRTLAKGGRLLLQTPNRRMTLSRFIDKELGHVKELDRGELVELLSHENLALCTITGSTIPYIPTGHRLYWLNSNRAFFSLWKTLNKLPMFKWDIIVLATKVT